MCEKDLLSPSLPPSPEEPFLCSGCGGTFEGRPALRLAQEREEERTYCLKCAESSLGLQLLGEFLKKGKKK